MIKFAVLDLKDICIKLLVILTILVITFLIIKYENINLLKKCIDSTLNIYNKDVLSINIAKEEKFLDFLKNEIYVLNTNILTKNTNNISIENNNKNNHVDTNLLTINKINNQNYDLYYDNINFEIKNNTKYNLDENNLIKQDLEIFKDKSVSTILIIHTHGSESYLGEEHTDYFRNEDNSKNMIRVGDELENILKNSGYNVIHDRELYDYPTYSGSYNRALESINKHINENNNIDIVLDLHRDAISSNPNFAPTVNFEGKEASKLMIIVGTDQNGIQKHDNWRENLKFALKLQYAGETIYPGLFRQMSVTNSRYNGHTSKGSLLIEVGATGNTLEQSVNSMHYLAKVIDEVLK
ncbi:MAG: hypothetical protein E7311_00565 [Clostridiales bacterium]|nr:hypothetical protein [Clostridiales bacterium]